LQLNLKLCTILYFDFHLFPRFSITANAVGTALVPYFSRIMEYLKMYLTGELSTEEMPLQVQALGEL